MAISFNFDSSPVKEDSTHICTNCIHFHQYTNLIGRCGYNFDFKYISNKPISCINFANSQLKLKRDIYICFALIFVDKDKMSYRDSGMGMALTSNRTDKEIITNIKSTPSIINNIYDKVGRLIGNKNCIIELLPVCERIDGKNWYPITNVLDKTSMNIIIDNLNRETGSMP